MKFDSKEINYNNEYKQTTHEFGELHALRDQYINQNRASYKVQNFVPLNIEGLTPLNGQEYPATRRWFRRTTSFERNGYFNIHTHVLNVKWLYWSFFGLVLWGSFQPVLQFRHQEIYHDNYETGGSMYDKILHRTLPGNKIWNRPS